MSLHQALSFHISLPIFSMLKSSFQWRLSQNPQLKIKFNTYNISWVNILLTNVINHY